MTLGLALGILMLVRVDQLLYLWATKLGDSLDTAQATKLGDCLVAAQTTKLVKGSV